ncbi:hypothetical protein OROHE_014392 [Orobanche hederae]
MSEEVAKKVDPEACSDSPTPCTTSPDPPAVEKVESPKDVAEEKTIIPPPAEVKADDSKALVVVER